MIASPRTRILDRTTLLAVRWGATLLVGALLFGGFVGWLPTPPAPVAAGLFALACALNLVLHRSLAQPVLGAVLLGDTAVLTLLLASSGGASNPFTLLFLFPVLLASLVLSPAWTFAVTLATTAGFASLLLTTEPHHHMDMSQHLLGMLVAYGAVVPVLGAAVHRFRTATAAAEAEAQRARASRNASERLASLAALAGGASHELATPLSTILVLAGELEHEASPAVREDLALIRGEVEQCRAILDQLAVDLGVGHGEATDTVELGAFTREAVGPRATLHATDAQVTLPTGLVAQAIRRLVGNARDACGPDGRVEVHARRDGDHVRFEVTDDGPGMTPDVLARACDPFFTTKGVEGHGLGLFFVHSLAHQLGGTFTLASRPGHGTTATLVLPGSPR